MSSVILYHHLGLGDHFMCHGIVREYCKKYDKVALFCYPHNYPSVAFMYRDLKNLNIIQGNDAFARQYIASEAGNGSGPDHYDEVRLIGFEFLDEWGGRQLEKQFYALAGVPLEKKWDSFYIERDPVREKALFDKVAPKGDYAFIHEDLPRQYLIKRNKIGAGLEVFSPQRAFTENIIDYCLMFEKAKEIHVIDSSFMFLIDCLPYSNPTQKLFVHRYSRENDEWKLPILKKPWTILSDSEQTHKPPMTWARIVGYTKYYLKRVLRAFGLMKK